MTRPRCLESGQTYLVTRRCSQRQFLLRPGPVVNRILLYLLAIAAERFGVEVHAFAFLSNHYHLVLTDDAERVRLPEFMGWFNLHGAKLLNSLWGRSENLWEPGSYNAVVLADEEAVLDKIAYTICNPVAAGLVEEPELWPGLRSLPSNLERHTFRVAHPERYFKAGLPAHAELQLTRPPCFEERSKKAYRKLVADRVKEMLGEVRESRARAGNDHYLGREAVLKQSPTSRPIAVEAKPGPVPCVACKDKERREELLEGLRRFDSAHREALVAWRDGEREVAFPAGTYGMVRFHNARCHKSPGVFSLE